jgi:hypothetical protein
MPNQTMTTSEAQRDMRDGYFSGALGMFASALTWAVAGVIALQGSTTNAVWALFIGGMMIHPVGVLLCKVVGRPGKHSKANPLGALAMENTVWLILSLPLAYGLSLSNIHWFFPAMLLVIGGRFFTFHTVYGIRTYWLCGAALAAAGYFLAKSMAAPHLSAFVGATIEFSFAVVIAFNARREKRMNPSLSATPDAARLLGQHDARPSTKNSEFNTP